MAAVFAGVQLPITPLQILWINMTTAVLLGLMLAFEPKEPGIMNRPPLDPPQPLLTPHYYLKIRQTVHPPSKISLHILRFHQILRPGGNLHTAPAIFPAI